MPSVDEPWPKADGFYPSPSDRRKANANGIFNKESWILEGQDREAGFIFALRKLYKTIDFPEVELVEISDDGKTVIDEVKVVPKQLIGLPDYGVRTHYRDKETFELITAKALEQPEKRRIRTHQYIFNRIDSITNAKGPRQLCMALRDAMCGLLNAFRMGYVHREICPASIYITDSRAENAKGFMLSKEGKSVEGQARDYGGIVFDFTVCKYIEGEGDEYTGDTEIFEHNASTPTVLTSVSKRSEIVHSPIYDLDSFLWVLLFVASEIITDYMSGERKVKLNDPTFLEAKAKKEKSNLQREEASAGIPSGSESKAQVNGSGLIGLESVKGKGPGLAVENEFQRKAEEGAKVTVSELSATVRAEVAINAHPPMDVDVDETNAEQMKNGEEDVKMDEDEVRPRAEDEEEKKRKRDSQTDSEERRKAKGKKKATVESDDEAKRTEKQKAAVGPDDEDSPDVEDLSSIFGSGGPNSWYFKPLSKSFLINVMKPFDFEAPAGFKPPQKPQYVAFADDKMAHVIHTLLTPRDLCNKATRLHLLTKVNDFLADSVGLAPFRPLVSELVDLGYEYYVSDPSQVQVHSKEEVEEAFARYLSAFEEHMPKEDNWFHMNWYEGSDMVCKFERSGKFLGAFASPTVPVDKF